MFSHSDIWTAIDRLAETHGLSASGLAKRAGLDATTFNKSKRVMFDGRERWPSTESLAKILNATHTSFDDFVALLSPSKMRTKPLPILGFAQAGAGGYFDTSGVPVGKSWDEVSFPDMPDESIYALEIQGDSMLPAYRDGDRIVVSPTAPIRRGDRVVLQTSDGEIMAKELKRQTNKTIELASLNADHADRTFPVSEVAWMARIMWVSQ
ncbi:helix-turn-helix transcriptional regulator [Phreatobacter aquaticus]|uniref:Helix-turn-helix transcriptional regulator n=1 Tax=Phreatobacter aquaticus TaxID=2570229 RepID=A0A4D7QF66_9HYPH|nr:helix-turn-helix transcriptional regulator [Phreatobacter aquaticus]QCK85798.1 helix-turn-helix transcriptional regulator [Phreatobacter aquaticus]